MHNSDFGNLLLPPPHLHRLVIGLNLTPNIPVTNVHIKNKSIKTIGKMGKVNLRFIFLAKVSYYVIFGYPTALWKVF